MDRKKIIPALWGAVGGAIVLAIIGFAWGGWVTGSLAEKMEEDAVVERLASICVGQHNRDSKKDQKLNKMKEIDSWERGDYVEKQGWATMPGDKEPDSRIARACADLLMQVGQ